MLALKIKMLFKPLVTLFSSVVLLISASLVMSGSVSAAPAQLVTGDGVIAYVVDGDTFWVKADTRGSWVMATRDASTAASRPGDLSFKVRLLNVGTEESAHRNPKKNTEFGRLSSQVAKRELSGQRVVFKCKGVGKYGRPLCSIYVNGNDFGQGLVERGISRYVTSWGVHPWADKGYSASEYYAKKNRLGIWSTDKKASIMQWLPPVE